MPPSAGWGAVRHQPRQKIGAKLNQSILEMALVSRCQGERLRERDQAGAGRRGPGGRHRSRGTAGSLLAPPRHGCHGGQSRIGSHPAGGESRAQSRLHRAVPQFPHTGHPVLPTTSPGEGGQLHTSKKPQEGWRQPPQVPICTPTPCPGQSVPGWEGRCRARETKTPALDTNIDGSSMYEPRSLAN